MLESWARRPVCLCPFWVSADESRGQQNACRVSREQQQQLTYSERRLEPAFCVDILLVSAQRRCCGQGGNRSEKAAEKDKKLKLSTWIPNPE